MSCRASSSCSTEFAKRDFAGGEKLRASAGVGEAVASGRQPMTRNSPCRRNNFSYPPLMARTRSKPAEFGAEPFRRGNSTGAKIAIPAAGKTHEVLGRLDHGI